MQNCPVLRRTMAHYIHITWSKPSFPSTTYNRIRSIGAAGWRCTIYHLYPNPPTHPPYNTHQSQSARPNVTAHHSSSSTTPVASYHPTYTHSINSSPVGQHSSPSLQKPYHIMAQCLKANMDIYGTSGTDLIMAPVISISHTTYDIQPSLYTYMSDTMWTVSLPFIGQI